MLNILTLNTANYDDHPGWLDRLGFIAHTILKAGANVVGLTEVRYTSSNPFNTYATQYWKNQKVTPPADPASMGDQILALLNAWDINNTWTLLTNQAEVYSPNSWEGLSILTSLSTSSPGVFDIPSEDGNKRITQYVTLTTGGGNSVTLYNTHFALDAASRVGDAQAIVNQIGTYTQTEFFAIIGDLNAEPSDPAIEVFTSAGYTDTWTQQHSGDDGFTFAAPNLVKRIDYVWTSPGLAGQAESISIVPSLDTVDGYAEHGTVFASDHLGLCATFNVS